MSTKFAIQFLFLGFIGISLILTLTTIHFQFPIIIRYVFEKPAFLSPSSINKVPHRLTIQKSKGNVQPLSFETANHEYEIFQNVLPLTFETAKHKYEMFQNYSCLFMMPVVNCANIIKGVNHAVDNVIQIAKDYMKNVPLLTNQYYIYLTSNCQQFIRTRGYIKSSLTNQEKEFPLAYSMVVYKDIEMVERLLRTIYRPQNFYCVHADLKSDMEFFAALASLVHCFPNVFLASTRINVHWGKISVLESELLCMKDLYSKGPWKYFINLTVQEMPLKTNHELVKILTAYNGANDVDATIKRANKHRWKGRTPPRGLRATKGWVHIIVSRPFVDFILHNDTAKELMAWVKDTIIPDETFFSMLNHNPQLGINGTYTGLPETDTTERKPYLARYTNWGVEPFNFSCAGYVVRGICILSTGDLPLLNERPELFANKFHLLEDRVVVGCLEERNFNNTRDEYFGVKHFDTSYYESLGFVMNQVGKQNNSQTLP